MSVTWQFCPFHADEDIEGRRLEDDSVAFLCTRLKGHPEQQPWEWLTCLSLRKPKG